MPKMDLNYAVVTLMKISRFCLLFWGRCVSRPPGQVPRRGCCKTPPLAQPNGSQPSLAPKTLCRYFYHLDRAIVCISKHKEIRFDKKAKLC